MAKSILRSAVRNTVFTNLGTIANLIVGILFAGLRIRLLGVDRAGYMMLLETIVGASGSFGDLGFATAALRKISQIRDDDKNEARRTLSAILFVALITGGLVVLVLPFLFDKIMIWSRLDELYRTDAFWTLVLIAIAFLCRKLFNAYGITLEAFLRYDLVTLIDSSQRFLLGSISLLVLVLCPSMTAVALVMVCVLMLRLIVVAWLSARMLKGLALPIFHYDVLKSLFNFGLWAYIESLARMVIKSADRMILTAYLGSASLPYYVIGQRIYEMIHTALASQSRFLFPLLSSSEKDGTVERVEDRLRWFMSGLSVLIYGAVASISLPLLTKLIGAEFASIALVPFLFACFQGVIMAQDIVLYHISWSEGRSMPNAISHIGYGVLLVTFSIILIPHLGIVGASLSQLSCIVTTVWLNIWVLRAGGRFSLFRLARPLTTPGIVLILYTVLILGVFQLSPYGVLASIGGAGSAFLVSLAVMIFMELWFFKSYKSVQTLWAALRILLSKILPKKIQEKLWSDKY